MAMRREDGHKGMKVYFGRSNGEQTLGEIVKVNPKNFKIKQLEDRGVQKHHATGKVWSCPPSLCTPADEASPQAPTQHPEPTGRKLPRGTHYVKWTATEDVVFTNIKAGEERRGLFLRRKQGNAYVYPIDCMSGFKLEVEVPERLCQPDQPWDRDEVMNMALHIESRLSPEALTADGERPVSEQRRLYSFFTRLRDALGRASQMDVSEEAAWAYHEEQSKRAKEIREAMQMLHELGDDAIPENSWRAFDSEIIAKYKWTLVALEQATAPEPKQGEPVQPEETEEVEFDAPEPTFTDLAVDAVDIDSLNSLLAANVMAKAPKVRTRKPPAAVKGCTKIKWKVERDSEGSWVHLVGGLDLKKSHHTGLTYGKLRELGFRKDDTAQEWYCSPDDWRESVRADLAEYTGLTIKRSK